MKDRVKFGKIDCQSYPAICGKAGVNAYPSVKFYPPTKKGVKKNAKFDIHTQVKKLSFFFSKISR